MSNLEIGALVLTLSVLLFSVHILGFLFERVGQPRLVGEILAGVLLGPFVLGQLSPALFGKLFMLGSGALNKTDVVMGFLNWVGLFLLMFLSGSETRKLMAKENRRETAWLFGVGTVLPFFIVLALGLASVLPLDLISGKANEPTSALLILCIAVAVTSIPVISRIFLDLRIMHTRFASLILGFAVLEDIVLWGVLAVATAVSTGKGALAQDIAFHVCAAFLYMGIALTFAPKLLQRLHNAKWNLLIKASPTGYLFFVLFIYAAIAAVMDVNLVFAAFLAGFGMVGGIHGTERLRFSVPLESISKVARGVFIPLYFALVGYKLIWGRDFSFRMLAIFLVASSIISFISFSAASWLAGFRGLDILNLSMTKNARGGPGIVLATVAFEAGIINAAFYTTLVLTAVFTSQAAGAWLRFILMKKKPLLSGRPMEGALPEFAEASGNPVLP